MQDYVAASMNLDSAAVDFAADAEVDTVDAVILELNSDSSHILCGACLLYDDTGVCERVHCLGACGGGDAAHRVAMSAPRRLGRVWGVLCLVEQRPS